MKNVFKGYVYGDTIKNGWTYTPASGRCPGSSDSAILVYREKSPGLVSCKITLLK